MAELVCDLCEQEPAGAMYSNLGNGDTIAIGGACMLTFALATANELAPAVQPDQRDQYGELIVSLAHALGVDDIPLNLQPPKRRARRPAAEPEPDSEVTA